jgi:hypothetical protein
MLVAWEESYLGRRLRLCSLKERRSVAAGKGRECWGGGRVGRVMVEWLVVAFMVSDLW